MMAKALLVFFLFFTVALLMTILAFKIRNYFWKPATPSSEGVRVFGQHSYLLTWLKYNRRGILTVGTEWAAIILWALWLGRYYLTMNSMEWLQGDWPLNVQSYFAWTLLSK